MLRVSRVLVLSLLVVLMAAPSFATTSRVKALAGAHNYLNDDSNIFRWYGTLPSYTRMVMVEGGQAVGQGDSGVNANYQALGFTHNWGEDHWLGTWGFFVVQNSLNDNSFYLYNQLANFGLLEGQTANEPALPTTKLILMWGKEVTPDLSLGVALTNSNTELESPVGLPTKQNIKFTTIGLGIRWDVSPPFYLDGLLEFGTAGGDTLGGFDKSTAIDFAARGFWEMTPDATLVGVFEYNMADFSYKDIPASSGAKGSQFLLGAAFNFDINTNNMLIFGADLEWITLEPSKAASTPTPDQSKTTINTIPKWYVALESDITSWFTARVGANKALTKVEATQSDGDKIITTGPAISGGDFEWSLGAGFHLGEWDIDATFDHDVPFRLGYWLTGFGTDDPDPPITRISGTYRF